MAADTRPTAPPSGEVSSAEAPTSASSQAAVAPASSSARAPGRSASPPFLWEISKEGHTSYLFGTMHTAVDAERDVNRVVFDKLALSRVVFFEIDASSIDPMKAARLAMLPPGQSVKAKLAPERWKLLVDRLGSWLTPESTLEQMKPWMLGTLLAQSMLPTTTPLDQVLQERATKAGKALVFLETPEEQLAIIDAAFDVQVLDDMLAELPKTERSTLALSEAYLSGDSAALQAGLFDAEDMKRHPRMYSDLLFARNRRWIPKLTTELARGGAFVAVGAGHLVGDESVTSMLTKQGYAVKPVPPELP